MKTIDCFRGDYRFLSNFYPAVVEMYGVKYPTVEHAFQAAKASDPHHREMIRLCTTPGRAKRMGRKIKIREDWDQVKVWVMTRLVERKFWGNSRLAAQLRATGDAQLVEGNTWHDNFWGDCACLNRAQCVPAGENHLGQILMEVRGQFTGRNE